MFLFSLVTLVTDKENIDKTIENKIKIANSERNSVTKMKKIFSNSFSNRQNLVTE